MNQNLNAHLYLVFALCLLALGWKIAGAAKDTVVKAQMQQAAQIEKTLGSME